LTETCWFLECRIDGKFRGWIAAEQKKGRQWTNFTVDPHKAKRYSKEDADVMVTKISAFHKNRPYEWLATEHMFTD
jgi:hypothetical protein